MFVKSALAMILYMFIIDTANSQSEYVILDGDAPLADDSTYISIPSTKCNSMCSEIDTQAGDVSMFSLNRESFMNAIECSSLHLSEPLNYLSDVQLEFVFPKMKLVETVSNFFSPFVERVREKFQKNPFYHPESTLEAMTLPQQSVVRMCVCGILPSDFANEYERITYDDCFDDSMCVSDFNQQMTQNVKSCQEMYCSDEFLVDNHKKFSYMDTIAEKTVEDFQSSDHVDNSHEKTSNEFDDFVFVDSSGCE